jgi:hypothetical protein
MERKLDLYLQAPVRWWIRNWHCKLSLKLRAMVGSQLQRCQRRWGDTAGYLAGTGDAVHGVVSSRTEQIGMSEDMRGGGDREDFGGGCYYPIEENSSRRRHPVKTVPS